MVSSQDGTALTPGELEAALDGDGDGVRHLVRCLTPVIQAQAGRVVLGSGERRNLRSTTEDLTQEIFLALWRDDGRILRTWDPDRGSLETFVGVVARRRALSLLQIRHHNPQREEPRPLDELERSSPAADPERRARSRDELRQLLAGLRQQLSPTGWRIFEQLYVQERSVEEVQEEMQMSANTIYQWRHRLKSLARRCLDEPAAGRSPGGAEDG